MFKVGEKVVATSHELHGGIRIVQEVVSDTWIVFKHDRFHKSLFRHATTEEIAAGHRIDKSPLMQHLDKCEEVVKTWPKWKLQSVRDALGIPQSTSEVDDSDLEYHVSKNCKVIDYE